MTVSLRLPMSILFRFEKMIAWSHSSLLKLSSTTICSWVSSYLSCVSQVTHEGHSTSPSSHLEISFPSTTMPSTPKLTPSIFPNAHLPHPHHPNPSGLDPKQNLNKKDSFNKWEKELGYKNGVESCKLRNSRRG